MTALAALGLAFGTAAIAQEPGQPLNLEIATPQSEAFALGNLALLVINLPMVGLWVRLLRVPYRLLFPCIIVFCCIGLYSINNSPFDLGIASVFAIFGYWLSKHDFEPAPMLFNHVHERALLESPRADPQARKARSASRSRA